MPLAALVLGLTTPALADVPPRERRKTTVEPHRPPPMTPPAEPPSEPETKTEPAPVEAQAAPAPVETKTDPKTDATASEKAETKSGSCSVGEGPEHGVLDLSLLALLLSGVALTRRRD
ncbi:hypothetical protein DB30_05164 [Enhygromyxa salina]|uniref:Uncharacterized protein n=1 Tax=Enhygromyxa salina TaxID=215803 RepID=A0A0C2D750_9BACT|nr:hypothetical protein DB30_05164 [Enhygromyxa salina]